MCINQGTPMFKIALYKFRIFSPTYAIEVLGKHRSPSILYHDMNATLICLLRKKKTLVKRQRVILYLGMIMKAFSKDSIMCINRQNLNEEIETLQLAPTQLCHLHIIKLGF